MDLYSKAIYYYTYHTQKHTAIMPIFLYRNILQKQCKLQGTMIGLVTDGLNYVATLNTPVHPRSPKVSRPPTVNTFSRPLTVNTLSRPCTHTLNTLQGSPTGKTLSYPPTVNTLDLSCMNTRDVQECHVYPILYTHPMLTHYNTSPVLTMGGERALVPLPLFEPIAPPLFLQWYVINSDWCGCGLGMVWGVAYMALPIKICFLPPCLHKSVLHRTRA